MTTEEGPTVRFEVFGSDRVYETRVGDGENMIDVLKRLGLFPDDYIITHQGAPVPIDSFPEQKDYVIYKVPSGG